MEGSRPLLVEVQALVAPAGYGTPARKASGIDPNRLGLLVAVLGRRAGVGLGLARRVRQPRRWPERRRAGARPACCAGARLLAARPSDAGALVAIGEVGLLGELRPVSGLERRLREAARLGFDLAIVPPAGRGAPRVEVPGLRIIEVATLREAIEAGLTAPAPRGDALPAMLG